MSFNPPVIRDHQGSLSHGYTSVQDLAYSFMVGAPGLILNV
jgi:hypothetical protein